MRLTFRSRLAAAAAAASFAAAVPACDSSDDDERDERADGAPGADALGDGLPECPADPPADQSECETGAYCQYVDCTGAGVTTAGCDNQEAPRWVVITRACEEVECGDAGSCAADQVCVQMIGGAGIIYACAANPCEDEIASCACAQDACSSGACTGTDGRVVQCDLCGDPPCA